MSYVTEPSSQLDLDLLLALLNSKLLDWYFRLGSTNSKVNEYQFDVLPVPTVSTAAGRLHWRPLFDEERYVEISDLLRDACPGDGNVPEPVVAALVQMSLRLQEIEAKRVLRDRAERSRLAPESQPIQDAIDAVFFRCYGVSDDGARHIEHRLTEML